MLDYLQYRRWVTNAWEMTRTRRHHRAGQTLVAQLRDGRTLNLRGGTQDPSVFHEIFVRDVYRIQHRDHTPLNTVLDLGGNCGMFSARIAPLARSVFAYEPVPSNFEQLKQNVRSSPHITPINSAVGATRGTLRLYPGSTDRGTGRFSAHPDASTHDTSHPFDVPSIPLVEVFQTHAIEQLDLLKIDIEGAEHEVLEAAPDALLRRIREIVGEYHPATSADGKPRDINSLRSQLERSGFIVQIDPNPKAPGTGMFFASRR